MPTKRKRYGFTDGELQGEDVMKPIPRVAREVAGVTAATNSDVVDPVTASKLIDFGFKRDAEQVESSRRRQTAADIKKKLKNAKP